MNFLRRIAIATCLFVASAGAGALLQPRAAVAMRPWGSCVDCNADGSGCTRTFSGYRTCSVDAVACHANTECSTW
jgi:hypothetical protein